MSKTVALVTAGGSGMGAAAARTLTAEGFAVAILSSSDIGEALAQELCGFGITGSNHLAEHLQRLVDGAMIDISTAWAFEQSSMFPTSSVLRAGLAADAKLSADTYGADNVRMNTVLPGWIDGLPAVCPLRRNGGKASRWAFTAASTRSPPRWRSSPRTVAPTSPARTCASMAA
jgi:NAD(P)-dependent dehydrogenase (short-subunit alcohol dehydrogenase family)